MFKQNYSGIESFFTREKHPLLLHTDNSDVDTADKPRYVGGGSAAKAVGSTAKVVGNVAEAVGNAAEAVGSAALKVVGQ